MIIATRSLLDSLCETTQVYGYGFPTPLLKVELYGYIYQDPQVSIMDELIAIHGRPRSPVIRLLEPSNASTGGLQIPQWVITEMNSGRHSTTPPPPIVRREQSPSGRELAFPPPLIPGTEPFGLGRQTSNKETIHQRNLQDNEDAASVESIEVQFGENQVTTYHGFGESYLESMDDSVPEFPINLQGDTAEQLANFITQQTMDQLILSDDLCVDDATLRRLIDEIIETLRVPVREREL